MAVQADPAVRTPAELRAVIRVRRALRDGEARALRRGAGVSLADAAAGWGFRRRDLGGWELGKHQPRAATCLKLARMYGDFAKAST